MVDIIKIDSKGSFEKTFKFLNAIDKFKIERILNKYGKQGVIALTNNTPVDSGLTAKSWGYEIQVSNNQSTIHWTNSNVNNGVNIALILQYGHGTRTGGYVRGIDYINPAMKPVFDKIAQDVWSEVIQS